MEKVLSTLPHTLMLLFMRCDASMFCSLVYDSQSIVSDLLTLGIGIGIDIGVGVIYAQGN